MICDKGMCTLFWQREPSFAKNLDDAGIDVHYMGIDPLLGEYWMLGGITPVNRKALEELLLKSGQ